MQVPRGAIYIAFGFPFPTFQQIVYPTKAWAAMDEEMDAEIREELGIPIRVKPEPVRERKPWEEPDVEADNEPNLLVTLIGGFMRQTPCYRAWLKWKNRQKDEKPKSSKKTTTTTTTTSGLRDGLNATDGWTQIPLEDVRSEEEEEEHEAVGKERQRPERVVPEERLL